MEQNQKYLLIRKIYLYTFSLIGLVLIVIGSVKLVDLGLKIYVFRGADEAVVWPNPPTIPLAGEEGKRSIPEEEERARRLENLRQRQRTASNSLALILVGLPLYLYHWRLIRRET